jgi:hypothetical protein
MNMTTKAQADSAALSRCIESCLRCYRECFESAMTVCLAHGGKHVAPEHFRLMIGCAEICRAAAAAMMARLPGHGALCGVCAQVCDDCAKDCDGMDGMAACTVACRECAEHCREMAV